MQNVPKHSAILSIFIELPVVIQTFVLKISLSGRFTQVLLYAIVQIVFKGATLFLILTNSADLSAEFHLGTHCYAKVPVSRMKRVQVKQQALSLSLPQRDYCNTKH